MRSVVSALGVFLFLFACASSNQSSNGPNVSIQLGQVAQANDVFYFRGPVNIQYQVSINNPSSEELTLTRLDLQTIGPGAYSLRANGTPMNLKVAPNTTTSYLISVWGYSAGGYLRSSEPVTIRGTAYLKGSKSGSFLKLFNQNISPGY